MKCDELKPITITDECGSYRVYNKSDVDAAIDELKSAHHKERHEYIKMIAELNAEINRKENIEKRWFKRCMEARAENVKLKRALWLARAKTANEMKATDNLNNYLSIHKNSKWFGIYATRIDTWYYKWDDVERKCRAKAEEYK